MADTANTRSDLGTILPLSRTDGLIHTEVVKRAQSFIREHTRLLNVTNHSDYNRVIAYGIDVLTGELYCTVTLQFTIPPSYDPNKQTPRGSTDNG